MAKRPTIMPDRTPPSGFALEAAMSTWQSRRAELFAADRDLPDDEAIVGELLSAETANVYDLLDRLFRAERHADMMATAAKEYARTISARAARFEARKADYRITAIAIMEIIGKKTHVMPELSATIPDPHWCMSIVDEAKVPDDYKVTIPERKEINNFALKAALIEALDTGEIIDGAELVQSEPSITVRMK